jgi:mannose-1-phosphate guanylyltransferase
MKAVVLVGGEGTRLRPLTETVKKELLPLMDRVVLDHTLDHLARHGVDDVVLSSSYLEQSFDPFIRSRSGPPHITWIRETAPLDTGGAIVNALEVLETGESFFALNGDILTDLDLGAMRAGHELHGAAVTIALHHVDDARAFGLVETDDGGRVTAFLEKPAEPVAGDINAGTYLLEPSVLRRWPPDTYVWIEGEVFPSLIEGGVAVRGFRGDAYWLDLGTPEQYLRAHLDLLEGRVRGSSYEAPWIGPRATVDPAARLGRGVAIGPGAEIGAGAVVDESVLLPEARVSRGATARRSVLGRGSVIGEGAVVLDSVLGDGVVTEPGATLDGARFGLDPSKP